MIGRVAGAVRAARSRGRFPLLLGGDCPVMLGALAALQHEQDRPGLLFVDGHEDAWSPLASPTGGRQPIVSSGWRWGCSTPSWIRGCAASFPGSGLPMSSRSVPATTTTSPPAASRQLAGQLRALIRPAGFDALKDAAAAALLPAPWWLHTDLDVLASTELAAVDYPQPDGLTWEQLSQITSAALASLGCAGWSVCINNPDLDPGHQGAGHIISYLTKAIAHADGR